jgi:ketosteroid isomerase-like protein
MKTLIRACAILAALTSLAPASADDKQPPQGDPMASWKPPKVTAEQKDRKEIHALFKKMEEAARKGDLDAATALLDFPVLMVTDDSKGEAAGATWTREQWTEVMKPSFKPMPGMKTTHRPEVFVITDSLATAGDRWTMTMGKKTTSGRNSTLLVRKGGQWKIKAMIEGGWGDMPMPAGDKTAAGGAK